METAAKIGEKKMSFSYMNVHMISVTTRENVISLSGENLTEVNLIPARAGLFDLNTSKVKVMTIYPTHRNNLGR